MNKIAWINAWKKKMSESVGHQSFLDVDHVTDGEVL